MTFPTNTPRLKAAILAARKAENDVIRGVAEGEIAAAAVEDLPVGCQVSWTVGRGKQRTRPPGAVGTVEGHQGLYVVVWAIQGHRLRVPVRDICSVIK